MNDEDFVPECAWCRRTLNLDQWPYTALDGVLFCDSNCHQHYCVEGGDEYIEEEYEEGLLP